MTAVGTDAEVEDDLHRGRAAADHRHRLAWAVVAVSLLAIATAYARVRWPGFLPLGSDNDEYQLVGQALAAFESPVVAGVEGTKYPVGYPAVLAVLEWLRLPVAPAALVLNLVAVGMATGLVAWTAGRPTATSPSSPGAALAAGAVVATSVSVWNDAFSVMPELLTLAVVAATVAVVGGGALDRPRLVWLSLLAVVAVTLKTLTLPIVLGGMTFVALGAWVRARRADGGASRAVSSRAVSSRADREPGPVWCLFPAVTATLAVLAGMLLMRPFPDHTTGYVATFLLRDPFDASQGSLGPLGLLRRTVSDVPETFADLGRAIAVIDASAEVAAVIAVLGLSLGVLGAWRLRAGGSLGPFAAGAVLAYAVALSAWPYHSSRFGIPLVPIAALGAGWVVRASTDWLLRRGGGSEGPAGDAGSSGASRAAVGSSRAGVGSSRAAVGSSRGTAARTFHLGAGLMMGAAITAGLVVTSYDGAAERGRSSGERLALQHRALDTLEEWGDHALDPDDRLVSFDYREVAHRLDRDVWPLAYTRDVEVLWRMVEDVDADVVVKVDFHHARNRQLELLLEANPERFEQVLEGEGVGVWRVVASAG